MAIIPSNTQFRGDTTGVTIVDKGSSSTNARAEYFTMQDIADTVGGVPADNISGTGTANKLAKFTGAHTIANSLLNDNGTSVWNTGAGGSVLNVAFGNEALIANTGTSNSAIGYESLKRNTSGGQNTAIGQQTLGYNTTGGSNTANGYRALFRNTTGSNNVALGTQSLQENLVGISNVAVGHQALYNNTSSNNTALGAAASFANTNGEFNVAIGRQASQLNTSGNNNVSVGYQALYNNQASSNTAIYNPSGSEPDVTVSNVMSKSKINAESEIDCVMYVEA